MDRRYQQTSQSLDFEIKGGRGAYSIDCYDHHGRFCFSLPDRGFYSTKQQCGRVIAAMRGQPTRAKPSSKQKSARSKKKTQQQNPMGDMGAMMGDVNKTVMTGMGSVMGVKLAGAVISMIPSGK